MIYEIPTKLPYLAIEREIAQIDDFWRDGSGAYMAIRPCEFPEWLRKCDWLIEALDELAWIREQKVLWVMINKLPPDTIVPVHTDTLLPTQQGKLPRLERWHLPIVTNPDCYFWDEHHKWTHFALGSWWGPVPYWLNHSVENTGQTERIHVVVDLDTPNPVDVNHEPVNIGSMGDPRLASHCPDAHRPAPGRRTVLA